MIEEEQTYEVYYDKVGDFIEVSFGESAGEGTTEEIEPGIFITKDIETKKITDIGILDFKKRVEILKKILHKFNIKVPLEIRVSEG